MKFCGGDEVNGMILLEDQVIVSAKSGKLICTDKQWQASTTQIQGIHKLTDQEFLTIDLLGHLKIWNLNKPQKQNPNLFKSVGNIKLMNDFESLS